METITEPTSEASANNEAENTNANLSIESLASSFMEKVENEEAETLPTVAEDESTETESVDAAENEDGNEVLSQSDDQETEDESMDDEDADENDADQPKGLQRALNRINLLTKKYKTEAERVESLEREIESLKSKSAQPAKPEEKPALENIQNIKDLEVLRKEAVAAKKWALQNIGKDYVEVDGREYEDKDIRQILTEAEDYLTEKIPQRAQFLQQKQSWVQDTVSTFPWSQKGEGPEWELFIQIRDGDQYKELLDGLPNGDFVAATLVEGIQSIKARQTKPKAKPKAKTPPPTDPADVVAPPVESKESRAKKKKDTILGKGNVSVEQFASYLT